MEKQAQAFGQGKTRKRSRLVGSTSETNAAVGSVLSCLQPPTRHKLKVRSPLAVSITADQFMRQSGQTSRCLIINFNLWAAGQDSRPLAETRFNVLADKHRPWGERACGRTQKHLSNPHTEGAHGANIPMTQLIVSAAFSECVPGEMKTTLSFFMVLNIVQLP